MGDFARISLTGSDELRARLNGMGESLREKSLRSSAFAGADLIRNAAVNFAPLWTGPVSEGHPPPGTLKKSIIVKRITELSRDYRQTYYVTVRRGEFDGHDAFYALWVEYGHFVKPGNMTKRQHRKARESGTGTAKWVPPSPYMRPAFELTHDLALEAIEAKLAQELKLGNQ